MRAAAALITLVLSAIANAAHPILTEDPGTQGAGKFELELGFAARQGDPSIPGRSNVFAPQFSIGVTDSLDLIGQAFWVSQTPTQAPTVLGDGDTALDFKWRFYQKDNLAFAVRAGLDVPTGDVSTGLGAGELGGHAIGVVGITFGDYAVYANAAYAYTRTPGSRSNLGAFSVALTRQPDDSPLRTFIEAATSSNPDPANTQWPAIARTGFIYTVVDGFDVDAGIQTRLNKSAARWAWLVGATLRW
jgi:hypothetical protein